MLPGKLNTASLWLRTKRIKLNGTGNLRHREADFFLKTLSAKPALPAVIGAPSEIVRFS